MNKKNLIICVSSHNNYDLLENEVLKNITLDGFEFINIDDDSTEEQRIVGKEICDRLNIVYIQNKSTGVQWATQTLMEYISNNRPKCEWVIMFQHDNYPISDNFFQRISTLIENGIPEDIAVIGFNNVDSGDYTHDGYKQFNDGKKPSGIFGKLHLSVRNNSVRWAASKKNTVIKNNPCNFKDPFAIEIPLEASIGIRVSSWFKYVVPTNLYQFHLWFPDVMMQFLNNNKYCVILPDLYCYNNQNIKTKYGMNKSSANGAKNGQEHFYGKYGPHLRSWIERWGYDYENTTIFPIDLYKDTLIEKFYNYDFLKEEKPMKYFKLEY